MISTVIPTFSANFEGGSLGRIVPVSPSHYRVAVLGQADQEGRNRQASWYYFRIDAQPGTRLTLDLFDLLGEYNYRPGTHPVAEGTVPFLSYDQKSWEPIGEREWLQAEKELRLTIQVRESPVWVAHLYPYVLTDLEKLERDASATPFFRAESAGKTVEGRPVPLWTIAQNPGAPGGRPVVWVMARQHAWESATSWVADGLARFLLSPEAAGIRKNVVFRLFPMADPDGVVNGGVRYNRSGYDLNRNWDLDDPRLMPEIHAQKGSIRDWLKAGHRLDLFLSLHNTETAEYITGLPEASPEGHKQMLDRLHRDLVQHTDFAPSRPPSDPGESTTPGKPGRVAVYQAIRQQFGVPAFLMEQRVQHNPKLGRIPLREDRVRFGEQLAKVLAGAVH